MKIQERLIQIQNNNMTYRIPKNITAERSACPNCGANKLCDHKHEQDDFGTKYSRKCMLTLRDICGYEMEDR